MRSSKDRDLIHINDTYSYKRDWLCLTLYKRRITKKGAQQYDVIGYYPDLDKMLQRMLTMELNEAPSLQYIADHIADLRKWLSDSIIAALGAVISETDTTTKGKGK